MRSNGRKSLGQAEEVIILLESKRTLGLEPMAETGEPEWREEILAGLLDSEKHHAEISSAAKKRGECSSCFSATSAARGGGRASSCSRAPVGRGKGKKGRGRGDCKPAEESTRDPAGPLFYWRSEEISSDWKKEKEGF